MSLSRICEGIGAFNPQLELASGYECKYCCCSLSKVGTICCVVLQNGTGNIERTGCEHFQIERRHLSTRRAIENKSSPFLQTQERFQKGSLSHGIVYCLHPPASSVDPFRKINFRVLKNFVCTCFN